MQHLSLDTSSRVAVDSVVTSPPPSKTSAISGRLARLENFFTDWQSKRLDEIPREVLWAKALQDTRSFAEIRRAKQH